MTKLRSLHNRFRTTRNIILADKEDLESLTSYSLEHGGEIKNESSHIELVKSHLNDYLV